jgi:hypothetical protein
MDAVYIGRGAVVADTSVPASSFSLLTLALEWF